MYDGDCLQMTVDSPSQAGCAWQPDKYDFSEPIDVEISANFGTDNGGADGICMVFQLDPAGLGACGPVGGAIASGGIMNSLIIEFDTWQNGNFNDPPLDHVAVNINGDMGNPISPVVELGNIEDGQDYLLRFTWNPLTTSYAVYFDNTLVISGTFDIPANCFGGETEAYYGFTSSTGAAVNNHVICPVMEYINEFLEAEICEGDTLFVNGESYTTQGQYTQMLVSEEACDTILFINLLVDETYEFTSGYAICAGDSVNVNGEIYNEAGSYVQVYTTSKGCDSILNINISLFPVYEDYLSFTIESGEVLQVGEEEYTSPGNYVQELTSKFGCDSIVYINVSLVQDIVYFSLDSCEALIGVSNNNYEEFTPAYPENLECGSVSSSILYRDNPEINLHSCTYGVNGNPTMCVGSLDDCNFDAESDKAVRIDLVLTPDPDSELSLSGLSFYENSPVNFNWINGNSGPNNYPTLYGVAVYRDGILIYEDSDIPTTNDFSLESFDFSDLTDFTVTEETSFQIVLLGYCLIGNGSAVAAWDLDEVNIQAICAPLPDQSGKISGTVLSPAGEPIHQVAIKRTQIKQQPKELVSFTSQEGEYGFPENPGYFNYELEAFKNNEKLKGVTTLDLLLIQKHLLEINVLDTPEKWIAADINNSKSITSLDILLLRKLILGIDAEYPDQRSWAFIPSSQQLDLDDPWTYATTLKIDALSGDQAGMDFMAIKIGDVNNSYTSDISSSAAFRNPDRTAFIMHNEAFVEGQSLRIPVYARSIERLSGFQCSIEFEAGEIIGLKRGQIDFQPDQYRITGKRIIIAWDNLNGLDTDKDEVLFYLDLLPGESGYLSNTLGISETTIKSELISGVSWDRSDLELLIDRGTDTKDQFLIGQNYPNPFSSFTQIPIELYEDAVVQFQLYDLQGSMLYGQNYELSKGQHTIELKSEDVGMTGVLFFTVQTSCQLESGRILRIGE